MQLDVKKYWSYVEHFDLTEEQKIELLRTVWVMMGSVVGAAFGEHPVQICQKEKAISNEKKSAGRLQDSGKAVKWSLSSQFENKQGQE